jgi:hypothetical protein
MPPIHPSHPSHPSHPVGHCEFCDGSGARFGPRGDTDNLNAITYIISLHSGVWGLPTVEAVCVRASEPLSESSDLLRHVWARRLHRDCLRACSDTFCLLLAYALHFPFSDDSSHPSESSESSEPSSWALERSPVADYGGTRAMQYHVLVYITLSHDMLFHVLYIVSHCMIFHVLYRIIMMKGGLTAVSRPRRQWCTRTGL